MNENFNTYNINADDAACVIAKGFKRLKTCFFTYTAGLYQDFNDKNSLISKISLEQAKILTPKIESGMHVK